jgi:hypothetical protein
MKLSKLCLAILAGFLLGITASRLSFVPVAKASPQGAGKVHVYIVPEIVLSTNAPRSLDLPGGRIAGISCIPKPSDKLPDEAICYVATSDLN